MNNITIGILGTAGGLLLIALGMPIGAALGLVSFAGLWTILSFNAAVGTLSAVPYSFVGDWNLTAVPMFLLMGYVASNSGLSQRLFLACRYLLARLPGGLAVASVGACALMSAASGSSMATASAMAKIASPEMLRYGYDRGLASGVIASAGTLGSLIPPSILLLLYGFFSGASVGKLFLAGVVPGLLTAALYSAMIIVRVRLRPSLAPASDIRATPQDLWQAVRGVWPLPLIIIGVLIGIAVGVFSPTEAGAVGASLSVCVAWLTGGLTRKRFLDAVYDTLVGTASVFLIVIGTVLLARFMTVSGIPSALTQMVVSDTSSATGVVALVAILYLILGCFIDSIGLLLLTLPLILPIVNSVGMDLIWFGVLVVKLLEIGMVTPPVGLNVYVINTALKNEVPLGVIFRGVTWFVVMDLITLVLLIEFPQIVLWLPAFAR